MKNGIILLLVLVFASFFYSCKKVEQIRDIEELPIYQMNRQGEGNDIIEYVLAGDGVFYYRTDASKKYKSKGKMKDDDFKEFVTLFQSVRATEQYWGTGCGNLEADDEGYRSYFSYYETNNLSTNSYFPFCKYAENHKRLMELFKSNL